MAFQFKARVLLELGAELISSDPVAIYELVKNSLDASATAVELDIKVGMQPSVFQQLKSLLESYQDAERSGSGSDFDASKFNRIVRDSLEDDAAQWSRDQLGKYYGNPLTLAEAIENLNEAFMRINRISVRDDGHGMTADSLRKNYLTVGTPGRLLEKRRLLESEMAGKSRFQYKRENQKLPLGEKGIGRLSAMRLGHRVRVQTKQSGEKEWNTLVLDWRPAFLDPNLDASDPVLDFKVDSRPCEHAHVAKFGTLVSIKAIQSDWSRSKVIRMVNDDLAKLADPFASLKANKFLKVRFQDELIPIPILDREPFNYCDAVVESQYTYDENNEPTLSVSVDYKTQSKQKTSHFTGEHLRSCVREEPLKKGKKKGGSLGLLVDADIVAQALKHLGPWTMKFYWYNRGRTMREKHELYQETLRPFLNQWAGGFLVYRDGYRVYPYGERSDDWLDLDRHALSGKAFKLNRSQIVGYVRLSSVANPMLLDQTNREGFRDSLDKEALKRLLRYAIIGYCRPFLEEVEKAALDPLDEVVAQVENRIATSKEVAISELRNIQQRLPVEKDNIAKVMHHLEEVNDAWERAKLRILNFEQEIESYIHLAGVGLMLEFIAHELSRITQDTLKAVVTGRLSQDVVQAQLKTLERRVRILDELSIPGRQIRQMENIQELVSILADFHQAKSERHEIAIKIIRENAKDSWEERLEKGQFLQILDNLLSNSFYWLINRLDKSVGGVIHVEIDKKKREVRVTDNGPGIPEKLADSVFGQFFTTKPPRDGRGLGLYIAKRLAEENNATLKLAKPDAKGMHHTFILAFGK